jgi:hypothetical protein
MNFTKEQQFQIKQMQDKEKNDKILKEQMYITNQNKACDKIIDDLKITISKAFNKKKDFTEFFNSKCPVRFDSQKCFKKPEYKSIVNELSNNGITVRNGIGGTYYEKYYINVDLGNGLVYINS